MVDRARLPTLGLPAPGERFGAFELLLDIAHGGMAAVYLARRAGGPARALKVILPHLADDRDFVDMFMDEAGICASIQHPNVIQVYELGEEAGLPFMVMEYVNGQTLRQISSRTRGRPNDVPVGTLLSVLAQAADGLHGAHETRDAEGHLLNIVHRDVSPDNILVGYDGVVKVLDFGIARARGRRTMTAVGQIKGKLEYLAPEQVSSDMDVDRRVDIWAIGLVAFEVLTGETPFRGADDRATIWNVSNLEIRSLAKLRPDLPESLTDLVHACLEKERELRPVRCSAVARELREAAQRFGHDTSADISSCVTSLFSAEAASSRDKVARVLAGERVTTPLAAPEPPRRPSHAPTAVGGARKKQSRKVPRPKKRKKARLWPWLVVAVLVGLAVGSVAAWWLDGMRWPPLGSERSEPAPAVANEPAEATTAADTSSAETHAPVEATESATETSAAETNAPPDPAETTMHEQGAEAAPPEQAAEVPTESETGTNEVAMTSDPGESEAASAMEARETKRAARERARRARLRRLARQRMM
jgi:serine/threonine protein kinase